MAAFIGTPPMNLVPSADLPGVDAPSGTATIGIRPEEIALVADGTSVPLTARVLSVEYLGADQLVALGVGAGRMLMRYPGQAPVLAPELALALPRKALHFFDSAGRRLPSPSDETSPHQ